jgi:hypothetical protein
MLALRLDHLQALRLTAVFQIGCGALLLLSGVVILLVAR